MVISFKNKRIITILVKRVLVSNSLFILVQIDAIIYQYFRSI